jgi:hypothetical protein
MRGKKRPAGSCPPASFIRRGLGRFDSVFHTAAFPFDQDRFAVMKETIEDGGGHGGIVVEDGGPLFKRFVGGETDGPALIALAAERRG